MVEAAKAGKLKALYVVGSNPVGRLGIDPFAFSKSFVVVQDMFLTETANLADVICLRPTRMRRLVPTPIPAATFSW